MKRLSHPFRLAFILILLLSALTGTAVLLPGGSSSPNQGNASQPQSIAPEVFAYQQEFDRLTEELFRSEAAGNTITLHYTLADPEAAGISRPAPSFSSISADASRQAIREMLNLKQTLLEMDPDALRPDQLLTWKILNSFLSTQLSANGLELYDQPLSSSIGLQAQLPILLAEYQFYCRQDVEDYLALLSSIDDYYRQILAFEQEKTQAGLGLCDASIDRIISSCEAYLADGDQGFMSESFQERLDELDLTQEEKDDYISRNQEAVQEHFIPAYEALSQGLSALKGTGGNDKGLCYLPRGREYYEYLVKSSSGTSYPTVEALKEAILWRMGQDLEAMETILTEQPELTVEISSYSFSLLSPEEILEDLKEQCAGDFPALSNQRCQIKEVPPALEGSLSPAFYLTVPLDRPQDHSIYINPGSTSSSQSLYTTMAHEGWPGHMYQTQYFQQSDVCNLRKLLSFSGYTEGWATYVEYYAYGLDNGLAPGLGDLLRHNSAFTLALYALLDINIHYEGWDQQRMGEFLNQLFSISDPAAVSNIYYDIAENPANYLEYYVGYLEISDMEKEAKEALKDSYSPLKFHTFLLELGPAPFDVVREYFEGWVAGEG